MHPDIIIASRMRAGQLLTAKGDCAIHHLISIGAPGDPMPAGFERCDKRIRLEFHDISQDTDFEFGPRLHHVDQVVDFARAIEHEQGTLLVHCEAGISRSSAAALTVFATWLGAGEEQQAVDRTYAVQPRAWPNGLFVTLADELLGRDGALIAAVNKAVAALDVRDLLLRYARSLDGDE
jgi:predicted protein tyrosine phosphatase